MNTLRSIELVDLMVWALERKFALELTRNGGRVPQALTSSLTELKNLENMLSEAEEVINDFFPWKNTFDTIPDSSIAALRVGMNACSQLATEIDKMFLGQPYLASLVELDGREPESNYIVLALKLRQAQIFAANYFYVRSGDAARAADAAKSALN